MIIDLLKYVITVVCFICISLCNADDDFLTFAQNKVGQAIESNRIWNGPTKGPNILSDKKIIFVASDLRNGGVYGVAKGMSEAISHLDWHLRFIDGRGSEIRQGAALRKAIQFKPDAIVLGGIDAQRHKDILKLAQSLGVVVVGWHAAELAGANDDLGLYMNITTDPLEVAEIAALLAIVDSNGYANAIIFSDPNYKIAELKANVMVKTINRCKKCRVLKLKSLPLDKIAEQLPSTFEYIWQTFGEKTTHILTINDLYIDYAIPSLESRSEDDKRIPKNISAGDGSQAAYKRINDDNFQLATVPEPLFLQGWQIIDEINRALHRQPASGYSSPAHLVTPNNIGELFNKTGVGVYDPQNGYREAYLNIWKNQ